MGISIAIARIFDLIFLVLFITIFLSWIPNVNWQIEPLRSLRIFSEIFFYPFRKLIPPVGMIDLSPIAAFICLSVLKSVIVGLLADLGL